KRLRTSSLVEVLRQAFEAVEDQRNGPNKRYELADVALSAFAVFFTQSPSFLAYQRSLQVRQGRCNLESIFGVGEVPSDNQIRNVLDRVSWARVNPVYREIFLRIEASGLLERRRSYGKTLLIALDGMQFFSSGAISCAQCQVRRTARGKERYEHRVLMVVQVVPGEETVLPLGLEFIQPQDGVEKQDCELRAAERWLDQVGEFYARRQVTLLGDDLYSHVPFCQKVWERGIHFLFTCKAESHPHLYQTLAFLEANGGVERLEKRYWNGRHGELWRYRFVNEVALSAEGTFWVNWLELTIVHEESGEVLYRNAWVTRWEVNHHTVEGLAQAGRSRWKVENENINILKTKGYHVEHNFGHGKHNLANLLLALNVLAFLFHTVAQLVDEVYQSLRRVLGSRRRFFQHIEALLQYFVFESWEALLEFMYTRLELNTS
ncbi:MAG: ISNCY family transposase, partial [Anaerolineales bacterium]